MTSPSINFTGERIPSEYDSISISNELSLLSITNTQKEADLCESNIINNPVTIESKNETSLSISTKNSKEDNNQQLLSIFELCDDYMNIQHQIEGLLKNGFFQLAVAKKDRTSSVISISDCRFEIDPTASIEMSAFKKDDDDYDDEDLVEVARKDQHEIKKQLKSETDTIDSNNPTKELHSCKKEENEEEEEEPILEFKSLLFHHSGSNSNNNNNNSILNTMIPDPAYLFSGLPSKALRRSQADFKIILQHAIILANHKNKLLTLINQQNQLHQ